MEKTDFDKLIDEIYYITMKEQIQKQDRETQIRRYIEVYEELKEKNNVKA